MLGLLTADGLHGGGGPQVGEVTRLGGVTPSRPSSTWD